MNWNSTNANDGAQMFAATGTHIQGLTTSSATVRIQAEDHAAFSVDLSATEVLPPANCTAGSTAARRAELAPSSGVPGEWDVPAGALLGTETSGALRGPINGAAAVGR